MAHYDEDFERQRIKDESKAMTKDKTVTMSRELAERLAAPRNTSEGWIIAADAVTELRAILAAPIVEADGMGEAVAIMTHGSEGNCCIWFSRPPDGTLLYASQPAPVSVVLPERRVQPNGFTGKGWAELRGWNACLDKVKELNK